MANPMMPALVYTGVETLTFQAVSKPVPGPGEVLIRVLASGICGSDMHAYLGHDSRRPAPLILGHEAAGVIEGGPRDGERVILNPLVACGTCRACLAGRDNLCPERKIISMPPREGAFAGYVTTPPDRLVTMPDGFAMDKAALTEPLACSWHAVRLALAAAHMRDTALVIGGGAIGLGAALALAAQGVPDVTLVEPNDLRRAFLTENCGLTCVATSSAQFDIVVDAVGYGATREMASACTTPGGVIAHIGLGSADPGLDVRRMTLQEITLIGTYTYTSQDFKDTAAAMFAGRLGPLDWTLSRPLSNGAQAFADIRAGRIAAPKIILTPQEEG